MLELIASILSICFLIALVCIVAFAPANPEATSDPQISSGQGTKVAASSEAA